MTVVVDFFITSCCLICLLQALATLKQKVKKYNKDFEASVVHCRANPDLYQEDEEGGDDDDNAKEGEDDCGKKRDRDEIIICS